MITNTSAPVDVLAYLDTPCPKMQAARAAVAELVEVSRRCATLRPGGAPYHQAHTDLRAILAKFGGAA